MSSKTDPNSRKLQIRKYPNRRYYDSTRSQHVTLEEIYALIRKGYDIEVIDRAAARISPARFWPRSSSSWIHPSWMFFRCRCCTSCCAPASN